MASGEGPIVRFDGIRSVASGAIGAAYTAIGTSFPAPIRFIYIQNTTDGDMMFSFTGNTDHFMIPAEGFVIFDLSSNKVDGNDGFFLQKGTTIYVKRITIPTTGTVYVTTVYGL